MSAQGLYSQAKNGFLYNLVYRAFRNRLSPEDFSLSRTYLPEQDSQDEPQHNADYTDANWPLPIIKLNDNPQTAIIQRLISEYERLSLSPDHGSEEDQSTS